MLHFLFALVYMPLVAILSLILVVGIGGQGTWHRLALFDGYAHFLLTVSKEIYEVVAGNERQRLWSKIIRHGLAAICSLTFTAIFMFTLPAFMTLSVIAMCFNRK
jgi:hypothetical protein